MSESVEMGQDGKVDPGTGALLGTFIGSTALTGLAMVGAVVSGSVLLAGLAVYGLGAAAAMGSAWWVGRAVLGAPGPASVERYERMPVLVSVLTVLGLTAAVVLLVGQSPVHSPGTAAVFLGLGALIGAGALFGVIGTLTPTQRDATGRMLETVMLWVIGFIVAAVAAIRGEGWLDVGAGLLVIGWAMGRAGWWCRDEVLKALGGPAGRFHVGMFNAQVRGLPGVRTVHGTRAWAVDADRTALVTHLVLDPQTSADEEAEVRRRVRELAAWGAFEQVSIDVSRGGDGS